VKTRDLRELREHPPWRAYASLGLGIWLIIAAFVLPRGFDSRLNAFVVGALVVIAALTSVRTPVMRYAVAVLAGWLFLSTFALFFASTPTLLHDMLLSFVIFTVALLPAAAARRALARAPGPGPSTGA
jgi:hypothetical protein